MTRRCPTPGEPLHPADQAEVDRFAAYLRDPDPDRHAAYQRHYPTNTHATTGEPTP